MLEYLQAFLYIVALLSIDIDPAICKYKHLMNKLNNLLHQGLWEEAHGIGHSPHAIVLDYAILSPENHRRCKKGISSGTLSRIAIRIGAILLKVHNIKNRVKAIHICDKDQLNADGESGSDLETIWHISLSFILHGHTLALARYESSLLEDEIKFILDSKIQIVYAMTESTVREEKIDVHIFSEKRAEVKAAVSELSGLVEGKNLAILEAEKMYKSLNGIEQLEELLNKLCKMVQDVDPSNACDINGTYCRSHHLQGLLCALDDS